MPTCQITSNITEFRAELERRKEKLNEAVQLTGRQCAILGKNNVIKEVPPHIRTGNWRDSWDGKSEETGPAQAHVEIWSPGAFAENGFNYGALQEALNHPGEIGVHISEPEFKERWQANITNGIYGREITESVDVDIPMSGL